MEREFILGNNHTWVDWGLILTAKSVTPPELKTYYIDLDGRSGSLDLSESLTGEINYKDRTISASFWTDVGTREERSMLIREIVTKLHGKKIKIIEPDDPAHYFYGRVSIKQISNILPYATFELEAVCDPWRYRIDESVRHVELEGSEFNKIVVTNNGVKTVCPDIILYNNRPVRVLYNYTVYTFIKSGILSVYKHPEIKFKPGINIIEVAGDGPKDRMSFLYQECDV